MRFEPKDPDLDTILSRINKGLIDLQPDFQRGEVWSTTKKQRLIDTILRRWHIPPIHLVARAGGRFDVLDGQQRLTAIRDFAQGRFKVDGTVDPTDSAIEQIDGLYYHDLPEEVRNEFDTYSIRVFELRDYAPTEPHELFFRLNQPTNLTEAEKRNAFVGGPRDQVKTLVESAVDWGMTQDRLGFSNSRMNYDDIVARFLVTIEDADMGKKITAARITERYRTAKSFSAKNVDCARTSLKFVLGDSALGFRDSTGKRILRPNKATLHTWLAMAAELYFNDALDDLAHDFGQVVRAIEVSRATRFDPSENHGTWALFQDRSTSRVADVSSVILRDMVGWITFARFATAKPDTRVMGLATEAWGICKSTPHEALDERLVEFAAGSNWAIRSWT